MVGNIVNGARRCNFLLFMAVYVSSSYGMNLGLFAGDLKRLSPLVIKKYSQNTPVFINIKTDNNKSLKDLVQRPAVKLPPKKRSEPALPKLKASPKFPRSIFSIPKLPLVPFILPWIPRTPLLQLFPHWLPGPTYPPIALPMAPPIGRGPLGFWDRTDNTNTLSKLIDLKQRGALSTSEYIRFKKLLVK